MKTTSILLSLSTLLAIALLSACAGLPGAANLTGAEWQLIEMNGEPLPEKIVITLTFKDGQAGGNGGCNSYGGGYSLSGSKLTFQDLAATQMYCDEVMDYEADYFKALGEVKSYNLENARLMLIDQSGKVVLIFGNNQAIPRLDGTTWQAVMVGETPVPDGVTVTMVFAGGKVSGKSGCNTYAADYTQKKGELTFGPAGGTEMACTAEGVMELEAAFLKGLQKVRTIKMQTGSLYLQDEAGAVVMTLKLTESP